MDPCFNEIPLHLNQGKRYYSDKTTGHHVHTKEVEQARCEHALFLAFISHVIKTKNCDNSMNKIKNLGYDR